MTDNTTTDQDWQPKTPLTSQHTIPYSFVESQTSDYNRQNLVSDNITQVDYQNVDEARALCETLPISIEDQRDYYEAPTSLGTNSSTHQFLKQCRLRILDEQILQGLVNVLRSNTSTTKGTDDESKLKIP